MCPTDRRLAGHSGVVRTAIAISIWFAAMVAMSASLACGTHCTSFCAGHAPAVILEANNLLVTSVTSSCSNIRLSGSDVVGDLRSGPETCHVDILLSDSNHFSFDVPFTNHINECCCADCVEGFDAVWQPVDASAPPPLSDASPFPPPEASDE